MSGLFDKKSLDGKSIEESHLCVKIKAIMKLFHPEYYELNLPAEFQKF